MPTQLRFQGTVIYQSGLDDATALQIVKKAQQTLEKLGGNFWEADYMPISGSPPLHDVYESEQAESPGDIIFYAHTDEATAILAGVLANTLAGNNRDTWVQLNVNSLPEALELYPMMTGLGKLLETELYSLIQKTKDSQNAQIKALERIVETVREFSGNAPLQEASLSAQDRSMKQKKVIFFWA